MTTEPKPGHEKKHAGGELIIPVVALLFTVYYLTTIWNSPWEAQVAAFLVASVLLALIVIYLIRTALELKAGKVSLAIGALIEPRWILPKRLAVIALTVAYLVAIDYLGFTLTSFLFLFVMMSVLGDALLEPRRFATFAGVSAVLSLGGYFLFVVAFDTRFPNGLFEQFMSGVFGL